MEGKINLTEQVARDLLETSLRLRFDVCTCPQCREAMLKSMLAELPLTQIDTGLTPEQYKEIKLRCQREMTHACIRAIVKVDAKPPHPLVEDKKENFERLMKQILRDRNLDLRHYHTELLKRRIALRLHANKIESYLTYMRLLDKDPHEYDRLFATLCINVSEFFRDGPVWVTLRYLMDTVIQKKLQSPDRRLRIWSAGCANGEEPFSLAIVAREATRKIAHNLQVRIIATDIDKACLKFCEQAAYAKSSLANLDRLTVERYFKKQGELYVPEEELRSLVSFQYLDLTSSDFITDTDLILCRNVFIYFDSCLQKKILSGFCDSLLPQGFLLLGKTEILPVESECMFDEIDGNARIYRKK